MLKRLELLAPAGSPNKMNYAFAYGADAVYLGIPDFSLRVRINKFGMNDVKKAIESAHKLHKKVYVTINIYAHNRHIEKLPVYLKLLNKYRPDALIISDPGVIELVKKYCPKIDIHLSTQANATNWMAVKFWQRQGVKRVILGREVTLDEIKEIHQKVPKMELEYFVHGAMCMSYSGRCLLSAWLAERSANLGDCAQPCRWKYKVKAEVEEPMRPGEKIPVEEDMNGTYIFNSKDLCLIEYLPKLIDAGIISFKIEGRAKSVCYLASVVKAYRQALDVILTKPEGRVEGSRKDSSTSTSFCSVSAQNDVKHRLKDLKINYLDALMTRGYTTGFLFGKEKVEQNTKFSHIGGEEKFVGEVVDCRFLNLDFRITFKPHNCLKVGDRIKLIRPNDKDIEMKVKKMYNMGGKEISEAHGGTGKNVWFESLVKIEKYSVLIKI